ncbi:MAG: ABC transporter ATP-binding protein [Moraxellaceae bacterium]
MAEGIAKDVIIDVRGLTKRFGDRTVVDHIDLKVSRGEIFGFLGPNGSGKTTTIRMLCGLLTPDEGEGSCLGYDLRTQSGAIKREVGYMTQRFSYYEDLSIRENLEFVARVYGMSNRKQAVEKALEELGLASRATQLAGSLSGGWKQRLALAASLLHEPKLLLLDEPTAGVDPKARRDFWEEIHQLSARGITVLVSTHYMDEAERCHRLAYIAYGKMLADGSPAQLIEQSGLKTWALTGHAALDLTAAIRALPGALQVVPFGTVVHVCGKDESTLLPALQKFSQAHGLQLDATDVKLEHVFIQLMQSSSDNFKAASGQAG